MISCDNVTWSQPKRSPYLCYCLHVDDQRGGVRSKPCWWKMAAERVGSVGGAVLGWILGERWFGMLEFCVKLHLIILFIIINYIYIYIFRYTFHHYIHSCQNVRNIIFVCISSNFSRPQRSHVSCLHVFMDEVGWISWRPVMWKPLPSLWSPPVDEMGKSGRFRSSGNATNNIGFRSFMGHPGQW